MGLRGLACSHALAEIGAKAKELGDAGDDSLNLGLRRQRDQQALQDFQVDVLLSGCRRELDEVSPCCLKKGMEEPRSTKARSWHKANHAVGEASIETLLHRRLVGAQHGGGIPTGLPPTHHNPARSQWILAIDLKHAVPSGRLHGWSDELVADVALGEALLVHASLETGTLRGAHWRADPSRCQARRAEARCYDATGSHGFASWPLLGADSTVWLAMWQTTDGIPTPAAVGTRVRT